MNTISPYLKTKDLRIPPQSLEAEKALLGSIMIRPEVMHDVIDIVSEKSFYSDRHKLIWMTMIELHNKNTPIDLLSLSSRLKEKEALEQTGGMSYLTEIVQGVPSSTNAKHYAEIVQKKHIMRDLINASEFVGNLGFDEEMDIEETLDKAEKKIFEVTNFTGTHKFIALKDTLVEAWERIDNLHNTKGQLRGIPTGFHALDNKLAGLQKSDLIILAARPSMGKTSLALDIARMAAINHKVPIGIFSLEMSSQQLVDRMLAAESSVDSWKIRTGHNLSIDSDFKAIRDAMDRLSQAPIYIDDQPANNILKMRSVARRLKSEKGLGLIVVDYLQLMVPTQSRHSDNMVQQVTEISRSLKQLARELEVPVLALSQLSRAVESRGGEPRLSDLRDSGCLTGDTKIIRSDTGERIFIKDLVGKTNIPIFALNKEKRIVKAIASKIFSSGNKEVFSMKTKNGKIIKASSNHKFYTLSDWKRLDQLENGQKIAVYEIGLASSPLLHLAESDIYWDEIVSIKSDGVEEVFDATVPECHNFIANDFIVHNSIEQDADVVMFIHREDKYNKDASVAKPNIAKIMIEKHRNGPTGYAELYFDDKKTTFISVDKNDFGDFDKGNSETKIDTTF